MLKLRNKYFLLRHGESPINLKKLASCWPEKTYSPLTKKGVGQIKEAAQKLKNKIDFIFSSDILRTKQTAGIVAEELELKIKFDKRLRDVKVGVFNGQPINKAGKFWVKEGEKLSPLEYYQRRFTIAPPRGENYVDIEKRTISFLKDVEKEHQGENILIVGHKRPLSLFQKIVLGWGREKFIENIVQKKN